MLGLATKLLDAAKRGEMRRGREVRQLDLGYADSSLALAKPERAGGLLAGDRAPDAPLRGAAGQARRLFDLLHGPHWTLLGYEVGRHAISPRPNLHIHTIGTQAELDDDAGHFAAAYAPSPGDWFVIRPDGYIGAIIGASEAGVIDSYLADVGVVPREI